ncbi:DNA repair protein RecO [uncultured Duncaniella sp.]|uniref:DNA repair protein RecO n=1 Tax=uncultured Duncaniella sp. TaxID=2768039 RepID=UPI0025AF4C55|nr:DNA repair protein RecO C-terminal domain-containing protein [uncultured Duncaniella sp.]
MKLSFIALKSTRYSDSQNILTAYSRELGRVSMAVPAGKGKGASRIRALTMPLSILECETDVKPSREVMPIRQVRPVIVLGEVHTHPVKQMLAMFLAEVLSVVLRESVPDDRVYRYLESSISYLDSVHGGLVANFHICFLLHLGRLLGIEPDVSTYAPGMVIDLRDGIWRGSMPLHGEWLSPEESAAAVRMLRMTYSNMASFRLTREQRSRALDLVLRYYSLHVAPLSHIRSLEILRSMF